MPAAESRCMKKIPVQFLQFCIAGVIGLMVDIGVLYALSPFLGWYGARVVSFVTAASTTWAVNRRYAFQPSAGNKHALPVWHQYGRYMLSMLGGAILNYSAYAATLQWIHWPGAAALGVALGSCAGLGANYLSARYLVFKQHVHLPPGNP